MFLTCSEKYSISTGWSLSASHSSGDTNTRRFVLVLLFHQEGEGACNYCAIKIKIAFSCNSHFWKFLDELSILCTELANNLCVHKHMHYFYCITETTNRSCTFLIWKMSRLEFVFRWHPVACSFPSYAPDFTNITIIFMIIILLKFGSSNYSTLFTKWWVIVYNFCQMHVYNIML